MAWVFDEAPANLNPAQMLVAISLANHAASDGAHAYPSVQTIMNETRLSRRSVQGSLRALEEMGVIEQESEATPHLPAMYRFPSFNKGGAKTAQNTGEEGSGGRTGCASGAQKLQTGAQNLRGGGAQVAPEPSVQPSVQPTDEPSDTPLPPKPFDLWEAFCGATGRDYKTSTSKAKDIALRDAKLLVADGITVDDVVRCVAFMQTQRWRSGLITFGHMVTAIGDWRMAGKPAAETARASPNGKPPTFEDEMAAVRARRAQPAPDPAIETTWRTR